MASTKEIKDRINSVRETRKITNAMYLIASTKLRKAKLELTNTRPSFEALRGEVNRVFRTVEDVDTPYFYPADDDTPREGTYGCLVITADKGLAGSYNMNVIKKAEQMLEKHPDTKLFVVGEYGRHFFDHHSIPIEQSFLYTAQNPNLFRAREIARTLLEAYEHGRLDEIDIIYTDLSGMTQCVRQSRLLPLPRQRFRSGTPDAGACFEFAPSLADVLESVVKNYLSGYIYSALVDSFCSEQNARMTAMDAANQNAEELLSALRLQYNRVRQAAITQEITEISAGAAAQRGTFGSEG